MRGGAPRRVVDLLRSIPAVAERLDEDRVRRGWDELVGRDVARQTEPLSLHAGTLIVGVASSPWLHQLTLLAEELRERLNRGVGSEVIRELRFRIHPVTPRRVSAPEPPETRGPQNRM